MARSNFFKFLSKVSDVRRSRRENEQEIRHILVYGQLLNKPLVRATYCPAVGNDNPASEIRALGIGFVDLLQLLTAVSGTKRTCQPHRATSGVGGKADIGNGGPNVS
jgi:hypothetical protein